MSGARTEGLAARAADAVASYLEGDPAGLSAVVDELTPMLWHIARQQGLAREQAEDVVQTAWLRLLAHAQQLHDCRGTLKWLITTTKRESWAVARRSRRDRPAEDSQIDRAVSSGDAVAFGASPQHQQRCAGPEEQALLSEEQALVRRHFSELEQRCRTLLLAIAFTDTPDYAGVADSLGMPIGSIGPTRGRCLAKLRTALLNDPAWEVTFR